MTPLGGRGWVDEKLVLTGRTLLPGFVDEMGGWGLKPASAGEPPGLRTGGGALQAPTPATRRNKTDLGRSVVFTVSIPSFHQSSLALPIPSNSESEMFQASSCMGE